MESAKDREGSIGSIVAGCLPAAHADWIERSLSSHRAFARAGGGCSTERVTPDKPHGRLLASPLFPSGDHVVPFHSICLYLVRRITYDLICVHAHQHIAESMYGNQ